MSRFEFGKKLNERLPVGGLCTAFLLILGLIAGIHFAALFVAIFPAPSGAVGMLMEIMVSSTVVLLTCGLALAPGVAFAEVAQAGLSVLACGLFVRVFFPFLRVLTPAVGGQFRPPRLSS